MVRVEQAMVAVVPSCRPPLCPTRRGPGTPPRPFPRASTGPTVSPSGRGPAAGAARVRRALTSAPATEQVPYLVTTHRYTGTDGLGMPVEPSVPGAAGRARCGPGPKGSRAGAGSLQEAKPSC